MYLPIPTYPKKSFLGMLFISKLLTDCTISKLFMNYYSSSLVWYIILGRMKTDNNALNTVRNFFTLLLLVGDIIS